MKKHLRILYGADDRLDLVRETINVCIGYFDTIRISNSGPKILSEKLRQLIPSSVIVEDLNHFLGDLDSARRSLYHDVPNNEWFMWLDSDERPSQILLDNLDNLIFQAELENSTFISFYNFHHQYTDDCKNENLNEFGGFPWKWMHTYFTYKDWFPKNKNEALERSIPHWPRMCKKTQYTEVHNNFGGHGGIFSNLDYQNYILSPYPMNHYKHEIMIYQSHVTSTYFNVGINLSSNKFNVVDFILKSPQYDLIRNFQKETGIYLNNDLCIMLHLEKNKNFINKMIEVSNHPLLSDDSYHKDLYSWTYYSSWKIWANKFNLNWETPKFYCGYNCCKYKNIQL